MRKLTGKEYAKVAADHPNLVATKNGSGTVGSDLELVLHTPGLCHFMGELDFTCAGAFCQCGLLVSLSSINPAKAHELFRYGRDRDIDKLNKMTTEIFGILELLFTSLASGQHMDGAYDKAFARISVPEFPLRLLPPYNGTSEEEFDDFVGKVAEQYPGWV